MRRLPLLSLLVLVAAATAGPAVALAPLPETIPLPRGFEPEGIASGSGATLYAGSLSTGAVWAASSSTGRGERRVAPREGRAAAGLKVDRGRLFVAGAQTGNGYVYDARTGGDVATLAFAPPDSAFINDVVVTRRAAYFTDSLNPRLHVVALRADGELGAGSVVPLTGALVYQAGFNVNGIAATRDGRTLVLVQTNTGRLFTADARTGVTRAIDLGARTLPNGDGLLLDGRTLYVVQNRLNRIAVIRLASGLRSGRVTDSLRNPDFDVPTTLAAIDDQLYTVNARFGTRMTPRTRYDIVRVDAG